jgi:hypothetical protein
MCILWLKRLFTNPSTLDAGEKMLRHKGESLLMTEKIITLTSSAFIRSDLRPNVLRTIIGLMPFQNLCSSVSKRSFLFEITSSVCRSSS